MRYDANFLKIWYSGEPSREQEKKKKKETVLIEMQNSAQQNCKSESERPNNFIV